MSPGIVTEHLISLIAKQVNDNGLVVWYDPDGAFADALRPTEQAKIDCAKEHFKELKTGVVFEAADTFETLTEQYAKALADRGA